MRKFPAYHWTGFRRSGNLGYFPVALLLISLLGMSGCRSHFVEATIDNQGSTPLRLVEVDYPSASFGVQALEPGAQYRYRFKIQGSGDVTIAFTDSLGKVHSVTGPELREGQEGTLRVIVGPAGAVQFEPKLNNPH